jgi:hypothetical protein
VSPGCTSGAAGTSGPKRSLPEEARRVGPHSGSVRIPLRVTPEADESLVGFLVRLAERNRIENPLWLGRTVGISFATLDVAATKMFDLGSLSEASGVAQPTLARMAYWPCEGNRKVSFLGNALGREMVSLQHRRVCPQCLAASAHHRAAWDVSIVTVCPVHGVRLVDRCTDCGGRLGWSRGSVARCRCGADLRMATHESVPRAELRGVDHVHRALGLPMGATAAPGLVSESLKRLAADETLSLLLHLGWFADGARGRPRPIKLSTTMPDLHRCLDVGYEACAAWPDSFYAYLDILRGHAAARPGRYGLTKQLGAFADWALDQDLTEGLRSMLRSALDDYLGRNASLRSRSRKLSRTVEDGNSLLTLRQVSDRLGRSIVRVREILERHGMIAARDGRGRGAPILVEADVATALRQELDNLVDRDGVWRSLGCSRPIASALLDGGLLPRANGTAVELFGRPAWHRSDLDAALHSLEVVATRERDWPTGAITLSRGLGILRSRGVDLVGACRAVADGRLGTVSLHAAASGFSRIVVDAGAFLAFGGARQPRSTLSVPEAAKVLSLKQEVVYRLCAAEIIATIVAPGHRSRRVPIDAIDRFRATYVVPSQLGLDAGHHRGWTAERLLERGAAPVSGRTVDGGRQYVFRRADVERAGFEELIRKPVRREIEHEVVIASRQS